MAMAGTLLLSTSVDAQNINFEIGAATTSGNTAIGSVITEGLNKRGYKVEFKALGNCALARKQFEDANTPMLTLWQSSYNSQRSPACNLDIKSENIVAMIYETATSFCATGSKTFDDYMRKGSNHTVGVMAQHVPHNTLFKMIEQKQGNNHNILTYKNSAELTAAGKSKESEFVLMSHEAAEQAGFRCLFTLSDDKSIPRARDLWPENPINSATQFVWLMQKNMTPAQIAKLAKDIDDIYKEKEWQDINKAKGYTRGFSFNIPDVMYKIKKDREISIYE